MSIDRWGDIDCPTYELICDKCGEIEDGFDSFDEAVDAKKELGWNSRKEHGVWKDICPDCAAVTGEFRY